VHEQTGQSQGVGNRIRQRRLQRGITQEVLAKDAGVSQSLIALVESGKRDLPVQSLAAVAAALHVDPGVLIGSNRNARALESLVAAWRAYDDVRNTAANALDQAIARAKFINDNKDVLRASLRGRGINTIHLDNLAETGALLSDHRHLPPRRSEHPDFQSIGDAMVLDERAFWKLKRLIELASRLGPNDLDLLRTFAERLCTQSVDIHPSDPSPPPPAPAAQPGSEAP